MLTTRTHGLSGGSGGGGTPTKRQHITMGTPSSAPGYREKTKDELAAADDREIEKIIAGTLDGLGYDESGEGGGVYRVRDAGEVEEKADDAIDYEDIDEVADEEFDSLPEVQGDGTGNMDFDDMFGEEQQGGGDDDLDKLFSDGLDMDDMEMGGQGLVDAGMITGIDLGLDNDNDLPEPDLDAAFNGGDEDQGAFNLLEPPEEHYEDDLGTQDLQTSEPRPLTAQERLALYCPDFRPNTILNFNKLVPIKAATLPSKLVKAPKPLVPTKAVMESAPDTMKLFLKPGPSRDEFDLKPYRTNKLECVQLGNLVMVVTPLVETLKPVPENDSFEDAMNRDIELCCDDWDSKIDPPTPPESLSGKHGRAEGDVEYTVDIRQNKVCACVIYGNAGC